MIFKRTIETAVNLMTHEITDADKFQVGDVIAFELNDGEEVEAMAMKVEADGTIFAFVDCIEGEYTRKDAEEMLGRLYKELMPEDIRVLMKPMDDGSFMRFMTQDEVFGERFIRSNEEKREQFEPMLNRRNRIADIGFASGEWGWYWLKDRGVAYTASFCVVGGATAGRRTPLAFALLSKSHYPKSPPLVGGIYKED